MTAIDDGSKVGYDFRNQNGAGIWLPPNAGPGLNNLQRINPYAATADQLHPVGSIGFLDQRKFAYAKCTGALIGWSRLVVDDNYIPFAAGHTDEDGFEGSINAAAAIGDTTVVIKDTTARAKNYYEGGYFTAFHASGVKSTTIRIAASDAGASSVVTLYLDNGLPWAVVEDDFCDAYRSPYSAVVEHDTNFYECFVGLSLIDVTVNYYSWLQIGGPAWIAQKAAADCPGYDSSHREAFAWIDGTCVESQGDATLQRIGYALGRSISSYGDTYIMLQMG